MKGGVASDEEGEEPAGEDSEVTPPWPAGKRLPVDTSLKSAGPGNQKKCGFVLLFSLSD